MGNECGIGGEEGTQEREWRDGLPRRPDNNACTGPLIAGSKNASTHMGHSNFYNLLT